jgi:glycosyltransferase involved in cell wall biosynthesis
MKPRILMVGEASFLKTGYSTLAKELLTRLHRTGKYEIAEIGCFADPADPNIIAQAKQALWRFYFNQPASNSGEEYKAFSSKQTFAFGEWSFEKVCLDFMPDIVIDVRDFWMLEFEQRSPFRPYFHWIIMPPVDAAPQNTTWVSTFSTADAVFTYTDWAQAELAKYKGINLVGTASPGVDINTFKPVIDKISHKKSWGLNEDSFIIGTVMRNQKRKLFPDLFKSFADFLEKAPAAISRKAYMLVHSSYPDWWSLPDYLNEYGIGRRVLFTYKCLSCQHAFVSLFHGSKTFCRKCLQNNAYIPSTHIGYTREELAGICNLFDTYVQYANSEGLGIPQLEAGACGVPVFAVDYSAMTDVVRKLKGYPIALQSLQCEAETGCYRAIPNNDDLVAKLLNFAQLPEDLRKKKGYDTRRAVEKYYDWDKTAKVWESYIDSISLRPKKDTWESPPRIHTIALPANIPNSLSIDSYVEWIITNIMGRPDLINSYVALRMIRDLESGVTGESIGDVFFNELSATGIHAKRRGFGRSDAVRELSTIAENRNIWEGRRAEKNRSLKK